MATATWTAAVAGSGGGGGGGDGGLRHVPYVAASRLCHVTMETHPPASLGFLKSPPRGAFKLKDAGDGDGSLRTGRGESRAGRTGVSAGLLRRLPAATERREAAISSSIRRTSKTLAAVHALELRVVEKGCTTTCHPSL